MFHLWRLKLILTWLAVASTLIFHATNIFAAGYTMRPEWLAESRSTVEASQQDGPHILLRLDVSDVIEGRLKATRDEVRSLLREARIGYTGLASSGRTVQVHITDPAQLDLAKATLKTVTDPVADSGVQEMTLDDSRPGLLKFTVTDAGLKYRTSAALAQSVEVIKDRIRDLGAHSVVRSTNEDGILVRTSGVADPQRLGQILTRPGHLSFQFVDLSMPVDEAIGGRPPVGSAVFYSMDDPPVPYLIENRVILSGKNVLDAQATRNLATDEPVVSFRLDSRGTARFKWATTQNIGKPFAVILDDKVISAPVIREPIEGDTGQISGNFTAESANDLALLLRTGPLPARLTIAEEAR
ncbi:hypothetical protein NKG60_03055 [Mesorhizobium sp. M1428]|uniref:SecDF P1 head subdomain-containing protein n=1 Tax=unclassified Mesorhizobium TaxID=325217 RepID=UPI003334C592